MRPLGALVSAVAAATVVAGVLVTGPAARPGVAPSGRSTTSGLSDSLVEQFYDSLASLESRIPAEAIDLEALSRRLGGDPEAAVRFVADSVAFEPYDGVLRGPFGTLVARAGSSCDQSLLLLELLRAGGISGRLRTALTDADTRAALHARARLDAARRRTAGEEDDVVRAARATVDRVLARLPVAAETAVDPAAAPRVHCWVEHDSPAGAVQVDPVLGEPRPLPSEVHQAVPEELRSRLTVRARLDGEAEPLIEVVFAVDSMDLEPVTFVVAPADPEFLDRLAEGADLQEAAGKVAGFVPVVGFRAEWSVGRGFDLAGNVLEPETGGPLPGGDVLGGRLGDLLGGGAGGREEPAPGPPAERVAKAAWLEYRLDGPGGTAWSARRALLLEDETVASTAPVPLHALADRQLLVPTFEPSAAFVALRLVRFFRENRPVVEALAESDDAAGAESLRRLRRYPWPLLALAAGQDRYAAALSGSGGVDANEASSGLHRGEPGLLVLSEILENRGGRLLRTAGIDIARTGFRAAAPDPRAQRLRAELGVVSSILESRVLDGPDARSLVGLVEQAESSGIGLVALTSADDPDLDRLAISVRQRRLLLDELEGGHRVLALARPAAPGPGVSFGWWRVDPRSGEILGVIENREGGVQAATEYKLWHTAAVGAATGAVVGYVWCRILDDDPALARHYNRPQWPPNQCWRAAACGGVFGGLVGGWLHGGLFAGSTFASAGGFLMNQGLTAGVAGGGAGVFGPGNLPSVCGFPNLANPPGR
jgi:hypothetical protein